MTPLAPALVALPIFPLVWVLYLTIFRKEARNLSVTFDSELSFDTQLTKAEQFCFAQLRQLTKISFVARRYQNVSLLSSRMSLQ